MHELGDSLHDVAVLDNSQVVENTTSTVPWLVSAAIVANNAKAKLRAKSCARSGRQPKHLAAEQRRTKMKERTAATA